MLAVALRDAIAHGTFQEIDTVAASFGMSRFMENDTLRMLLWRDEISLYTAKFKGCKKLINYFINRYRGNLF
ncbi:hypothetical protein M3226_15410 [Neobacillus cucumis]|uniref:hypothetical protein n=1 Tax=Neobacillus cucumis TaxID=1740721 RepID=UPI00203BB77E|nr:hypothetical protein [Neobacillus cucumis]MCM3727069.1 hypothetical protein [Neobacillus cucumis]